jgi:hypothetical protein
MRMTRLLKKTKGRHPRRDDGPKHSAWLQTQIIPSIDTSGRQST